MQRFVSGNHFIVTPGRRANAWKLLTSCVARRAAARHSQQTLYAANYRNGCDGTSLLGTVHPTAGDWWNEVLLAHFFGFGLAAKNESDQLSVTRWTSRLSLACAFDCRAIV